MNNKQNLESDSPANLHIVQDVETLDVSSGRERRRACFLTNNLRT